MHELQAVASAFLTPDELKSLPELHAEIASYLAATGDIPLLHFEAFLDKYRQNYTRPNKKKAQLAVVVQAAAAQDQQQLSTVDKEASSLQKKFYEAAIEDHKKNNSREVAYFSAGVCVVEQCR